MKIIVVHNYYGSSSPSGENIVVDSEIELLKRRGHDVKVFDRRSDELRSKGIWGMLIGAILTPWNPFARKSLACLVAKFEPDIVHVHNVFPMLSPSIFSGISKKTCVIYTLHNYRTVCPAGIPYRNNRVCKKCIEKKNSIFSVVFGCYRNSRIASIPLAVKVSLHRFLDTWNKHVHGIIVLSEYQRLIMSKSGIEDKKLFIKPNLIRMGFDKHSPKIDPRFCVFVGRLSAEKGIHTLIETWKKYGDLLPLLKIVGDGPDYSKLVASAAGLQIEFLGNCDWPEVRKTIAESSLLIAPSQCIETFGVVLCEAFSVRTPVAASDLGSYPSIVRHDYNGKLFSPGDLEMIKNSVLGIVSDNEMYMNFSQNAYQTFVDYYTEGENYRLLMQIYQSQIQLQNRQQLPI